MPLNELLTATVGHVLTGLLAHVLLEDTETPKALERIERAVNTNVDIGRILQEAAACTARFVQLRKGYPERVRSFLVSPEVESILRQIFSTELAKTDGAHTPDLRNEFQRCLALHLEDPNGISEQLSSQLFDSLTAACHRALGVALSNGSIPALATKMTSDNRMILDEIAAIKANLTFLANSNKLQLADIKEFELKFRKQVGNANKHITPPNLESSKKVPIEKLFVPSNFTHVVNKEKIEELSLDNFLTTSYRAVILGNPGGGKSTFARKLCHDLAVYYSERRAAGRELTPILITLRDYGSEKKTHGVSILQFMERTSNSDYQLPAPEGAFEYLLFNGKALVVFDGLDELLDTRDRQKISSDVELFAELYPSVPIIVTSREVGYEQAPLDEERFPTFRLAPFSQPQIESYVQKWFATSSDLTTGEQKKKATSFLQESRIVPDLTSNPLMLALMCTIYRGEGTIPRNRPDVYGKCAEMLFEKWDKRRGIQVSLPIEAHVRPAMNHLASWIYGDEALQRGVPQSSLVQEAKNYLLKWCFDDAAEAEAAAGQFIEFCSGRAWVFTDTGTRSGGERLYQFTHRTFLEYFTAVNLVQTHRTPEELALLLNPRIAKREWDTVAQLAFQLKGKGFQGDSDLLIGGLLSEAKNVPPGPAWNLLDFAARCLGFMVPTPSLRRQVADACLEAWIRWKMGTPPGGVDSEQRERESLLGALLLAASENRATIADETKAFLGRIVENREENNASLAMEIGLHLTVPVYFSETRAADDVANFWESQSYEFNKDHAARFRELARKDPGLAIDGVWLRSVTINELVSWHGIGSLFRSRQIRVVSATRVPIAAWLTRSLFTPQNADGLGSDVTLTEGVGRALLVAPPPWLPSDSEHFADGILDGPSLQSPKGNKKVVASAPAPPDSLFGAFVLLAIFAEFAESQAILARIAEIKHPAFLKLRQPIRAWINSKGQEFPEDEIAKLGFSAEQTALLRDWQDGKLRILAADNNARPAKQGGRRRPAGTGSTAASPR